MTIKNRLRTRRTTAAESGVDLAARRLRDVLTERDVATYLGNWVMTWARAVKDNVIDEEYSSLDAFFADYERVVADDAVDLCDDREFKGYLAELSGEEYDELREQAIALVREYAREAEDDVASKLEADDDKHWVLDLVGEGR